MKQAKKHPSVKYFNMQLQSPTKLFRSAAYKETLHESFIKLSETKSPVEL